MKKYFYLIANDKINGFIPSIIKPFMFVASLIFGLVIRFRAFAYDYGLRPTFKFEKPVISVGNITIGGVGKTPLVLLIAEHLQKHGKKPAILIRGYMQNKLGVDFSDEASLLKRRLVTAPILIGKSRVDYVRKYIDDDSVDVFIMDDGFQHRRLNRNFDIVAIDSLNPFGNGRLLPSGVLREPIKALNRSDLICLTKTDLSEQTGKIIKNLADQNIKKPIIKTCHKPSKLNNMKDGCELELSSLKGADIVLLCSIGNPQGFEGTVTHLGAKVIHRFFYIDHYVYQQRDFNDIQKKCLEMGCQIIVTTEKDAVKLEQFKDILDDTLKINVLRVDIDIVEGKEMFFERIDSLF